METEPTLTREEAVAVFTGSVDSEAQRAAESGFKLISFGLVVRDITNRLWWFNRAHPEFVDAFCRFKLDTVAFVGVTESGLGYKHMKLGFEQDDLSERVRVLTRRMLEEIGSPTKETLFYTPGELA